jgi:L-2,4-diaminobutyric acid acetyltransferase
VHIDEYGTTSTGAWPPATRSQLRPPTAADASAIWRLVERTPALDSNSPYAYLLLCSHFAETGLVAERAGEIEGFVLGYARPDVGSTAFVWQVAVDERARGQSLGSRLLDAWFARCARGSDVRHLEATVTPSNAASRALFESFAKRHGAPLRETLAYPASLFPADAQHEDEIAFRIGPVSISQALAPTVAQPSREGTTTERPVRD